MNTTPDFKQFPKMARLSREALITEKLDGTNASICIEENFKGWETPDGAIHTWKDEEARSWAMFAGSRTRWITPENDNHGFAKWVKDNAEALVHLGPGRHFGEWWGSGINRGYGLVKGEKRLSMFNVQRWALHGTEPQQIATADPRIVKMQDVLPPCVGLVPTMYRGIFDTAEVERCLNILREYGSWAAPGYTDPEGVVVYHVAGSVSFKKTIEKDSEPKGK